MAPQPFTYFRSENLLLALAAVTTNLPVPPPPNQLAILTLANVGLWDVQVTNLDSAVSQLRGALVIEP